MDTTSAWHGRVNSRPDVLAGKPCIDGTRASVEIVLDTLSVTGSVAETAAAFPRVTEADVRAALTLRRYSHVTESMEADTTAWIARAFDG